MGKSSRIGSYIAGVPLAYYGYALQKTWSSIDIGDLPQGFILSSGFQEFLGGVLFLALIPLSMLIGHSKRRAFLFPLGVSVQVASALLAFVVGELELASLPVMAVSVILKAVGLVIMGALWIEVYAMLNPLRAVYLLASSAVLTAVALYIFDNDEGARLFVVRLLLPLASAYCYWLSYKDPSRGKEVADATDARLFPYKAVVFVAVCSFSYGSTLSAMGPGLTNYVAAVPAAVVMLVVVFGSRRFGVAIIGYLTTILMVCGYLMTILLPQSFGLGASIVLDMGYGLMGLMVLLIVCTVSYGTKASAIWLFGILASSQFVCYHLGFWFSRLVPAGSQSIDSTIVGIVVVVALVVCCPVLSAEKGLSASWGARRVAAAEKGEDPRLQGLRASYGLTERESEVLSLVARGESVSSIAGEMVVSESTVKSHLHNIYTKFGVHSRSELQRIINGEK